MYHQSCEAFIENLHSSAPTPGGGGASAYMGAVSAALGGMVLNLAREKAKTEEACKELDEYIATASTLEKRFLDLMNQDAEGFEPLAEAYRLPRTTPEEKEYRSRVMEEALADACEAPFAMLEAAKETAEFLEQCLHSGAKMAVSDVGVAAAALRAAAEGAVLNILINAGMMQSEQRKTQILLRADYETGFVVAKARQIYRAVKNRIKK